MVLKLSSEISKIDNIKKLLPEEQQSFEIQGVNTVKLWVIKPQGSDNYNRLPIKQKEFIASLDYLEHNISSAYKNYLNYDKGVLGMAANGFKEIFGFDSAQSKVRPILEKERKNIIELSTIAKNYPHKFRIKFKEMRKVDFSIQNIKDFEAKKEEFATITTFNNIKNNFNNKMEHSLNKYKLFTNSKAPDNDRQKAFYDYNYKRATENLEIDLKESLKDIFKTDEAVNEYLNNLSNELEIDLTKERTTKEKLDVWGKLATKTSKNINNKFAEITDDKSIKEHQKEYEDSYKKAYGEINAKELSDAYLKSQQTGEQVAKIAIVIGATVATMGAASSVAGGALTTQTAFGVSTVSTGVATTGVSTLDDYTKDGKVDNFKEHVIEGAKASGYSAIGFSSGTFSQSLKGISKIGKIAAEVTIDATASTIYGGAIGDGQTLGENFLYSGAFIIPGLAGARVNSKVKPNIEITTPKAPETTKPKVNNNHKNTLKYQDDGIMGYSTILDRRLRDEMKFNYYANKGLEDVHLRTKSNVSFKNNNTRSTTQNNDTMRKNLAELCQPRINNKNNQVYIVDNSNITPDRNGIRAKNPLSSSKHDKKLFWRLRKLKEGNIDKIIDLRAYGEASQKSLEACKNNDIKYINTPIVDGVWQHENIDNMITFIKAMDEGNYVIGCANGEARTDLAMAINYVFNKNSKNVPEFYFGSTESQRIGIKENLNKIISNINNDQIKKLGWETKEAFKQAINPKINRVLAQLSTN